MGAQRGFMLMCYFGLFCLIINTDILAHGATQAKRSSRITSSRSFGTNVKQTSSNGVNFDCPEEFGYYPHPTDCTQYYVCVFGGALLESCTGGLMYSHELQTCDWPRNVGCEVVDSGTSASTATGLRGDVGSQKKKQQSVPNQHVPSRVRFGSAFTSPGSTTQQPRPTVPQQYHRQPPQQIIQAQVQTIPPPPELRVPPNPVVTSRGQPKHLIDSQEEIAKLYADSDSLPPVEEEESDRQQRVYRGQPSTVSQVQRDRDGIIHQASINAIPNHGKIGSFAFGSQYRKHLIDERLDDGIKTRKLVRHKRELSLIEQEANTETTKTTEATRTETTFKTKEILTETHKPTEQSNATHIQNFNDLVTNREGPERIGTADDVSNTSQEIMDDDVMDITTPVNGDESNTAKEMVEENSDDDGEDAVVGESVRASRQLRPFGNARARWPVHTPVGVTNYRSIDASPYQQQTAYSFGPFNPFLTPPAKQNYQQLSPGYQFYPQTQPQHHQQLLQQDPQKQKSKVVYTGYNLSLPPPPVQDDFRPIAGNFYGPTATTTKRPNYVPHSELLPYIIQSLQELKDQRKKAQAENFSYFHLENPAGGKSQQTTTTMPYYQSQAPKQPLKVTPNSHYSPYSTVGGFYNNQAEQQRPQVDFQPTTQYPIKLISQFSIKDASNHNILPTTTESNYFKYNILANQKMKGFYSTAKASAYDDTTYKPISVKLTTARPPATNINIVSAPNLAAYRPDFTNYPAGIIYANTSSTQPESYQTFTSKVAATEAPKIKSTPVKPKVNLQFNIPDFVSNLQPSDLAGLNPTVMNMLKYFKQVGVTDKTKVARRPISSTSIAPVNLNQNEYEVTTARPRYRTRLPATTAAPTTTTFRTPTTTTATRPAPRPVKGYESFIKSIPKQSTKFRPSNSITTTYNNHNYAHDGDEYYDEYEEGEDESLGNDSDDQIRPPSQMPPYVPMSETMAPPRPHLIPPSPTTPQPKSNAVISNNKQNNYITGYFEATTARRPYFGADFQQFYQNGNGLANAPAKGTAQQNNQIPSFINFPTDFFQEIKQRLPQLHEGTTKRYNLQTATTPTPRPYTTTTISPPSTTPTPRPTTTTTSRTRYTLRPNLNQNRNRRPGKWPHNSTQTLDFGLPSFSRKRPASASSTAELGAVQLNVNMNLDMDSHSHRIESSSPTSQTPSAANLYVQPPRPNQLIVETIPSNRNQQQNRNYYNTSSLSHDYGGGYVASPPQSSSNIQHQQQQVPLQHHQQQQQSAQNEQSSYDTYYSVYDDDIDLYRDLEYQQQQQQQQQQQHQQQQPNHQTHYTQQRQPQQSSYRPLEIVTTPTPQQVPLRETYSNKPHNTERPAYNDQQSLIYNTDYDDDLIAQIEQDNVYDQPTRPPTRSEQVTIGALQDQPQPSSIQPSALGKDKRNYYSTLTTELPPTSVADEIAPVSYSYETSAEYAEVPEYYTTITERTPLYKKPTRFSTYAPKLVNTQESDEYNIIGSTLLEETTDAFDLTTNTLNPTTKNLKYSTAQNSNSAFAKSSSTTTAALAASLWTTSTATTTTTTTTPKSTTHKSTTQIVKTTTPATSTKAIRSEKQHAKEIPKNQLPKLPAQAQHTSSLNPLDSPTQQPTDKSRSEPLITFVAQTQSHSAQILQHTFKTSEPAHQREAAHEARSLASTEESETVSDESQNVHVKSAEKPRRDRKYSAEYATSPHGNLIDLNTNKPYRGKSAEELNKEARKNSGERDYISIGNTVNEKQRPRLQDFVVSDVEPQSFKPPATELAAASTTTETPLELVSSASSSTTTLRYLPAAAMVGNVPQPFKYSLQTGLHGFSLRAQNQTAAAIEETSQPIYERKPTSHPAFTSTTSQVSSMPFYKQQILPTTYAPPLRWWQNGRPKIMHAEERDHVKTAGSERQLITTAEAQTTSTSTTTATPTATRKSTPPPSSTTERPVQSFTARASVFKDTLSKTTGSPAGRYVSPYKSLENILQEKDERFGYNSIRTTAKPRYTSSASSPPPTSKPFRSYFLITSAPKNMTENLFANMPSTLRNFSVSDAILSNFSSIPTSTTPATTTTTTTTERMTTESTSTESTTTMTMSTVVATSPIRIEQSGSKMGDFGSSGGGLTRGRSRYTAATEPTTYAPRPRWPVENLHARLLNGNSYRRKVQRARIAALQNQRQSSGSGKYQSYKTEHQQREVHQKILKRKPHENEANEERTPRAEALVALPIDHNQENSLENYQQASGESTEQVISATERPPKFLYSNKYRQQTAEHTLADSLQNAGYLSTSTGRSKLVPTTVLEQLQLFLAGDSEESSSQQQFVDNFSEREITAAVKEIKNLYTSSTTAKSVPTTTTTTTLRPTTTPTPPTVPYYTSTTLRFPTTTSTTTMLSSTTPATQTNKFNSYNSNLRVASDPSPSSTTSAYSSSTSTQTPSSLLNTSTAKTPLPMLPMRASRVNNAIKTSIAAAYASSASATPSPAVRSNNKLNGLSNTAAAVKCSDSTSNAKCNEIPTRTNANSNRNRGSAQYAHQDRDLPASSNRGTHPPRTRPTLKPSGTIVSKAQEFVDIYKNLPARPEPLYPQPTPDKTAAKCRRDVCLLPDCYCGGRDIPADLPVESVPQIVLLTFDDSVNDLNKQLYSDLFEKGRVNPNGCPITATFYVSHEWTDYSQVQNLYADGHEMASHTVSHSFGEQFSQKKWTREVAGQREILAAYGGVKLDDVRGMRAPFLSVGGNKMYKMLYDANFTYDSSMPVYENRPPSWPYTLDYKIFHDCMIPPCPTRSYPGVWQVPMVMWQDLNGGRCSMGDACSNPSESDGVYKMIMKNFERHYTTNRAPFGLFYHAAWFTQPHHKEGFIKFLDAINQMPDVWIITNWQMLQWVRDPTPISRINSFQPFQCDYSDRPKRCNNPKVCNLWHKSGVRYMKTCQPCPDIYPWTGKTGIRSSRIDNYDIEESTT